MIPTFQENSHEYWGNDGTLRKDRERVWEGEVLYIFAFIKDDIFRYYLLLYGGRNVVSICHQPVTPRIMARISY